MKNKIWKLRENVSRQKETEREREKFFQCIIQFELMKSEIFLRANVQFSIRSLLHKSILYLLLLWFKIEFILLFWWWWCLCWWWWLIWRGGKSVDWEIERENDEHSFNKHQRSLLCCKISWTIEFRFYWEKSTERQIIQQKEMKMLSHFHSLRESLVSAICFYIDCTL